MMGGGVRRLAVGVALGVTVRVGVMEGGGAGSQIMGVVVGGRGVVGGGGAGSQMGGDSRQAVLVPPKTMTMARMAVCRSLGSLVQGIIGLPPLPYRFTRLATSSRHASISASIATSNKLMRLAQAAARSLTSAES